MSEIPIVRKIEAQSKAVIGKIPTCAYARVSTDSRSQEGSLENQIETYKRMISSNPAYQYVGVYADQGISGYSENRPQFQKMLEEARKGKIKFIITKSISRFARNTVTVLKIIREMKELGVGIFFEEQNINTLSEEGEVMVSVLSSYAQEESRSISENNKWSLKKKFERGELMINTTRFCGYDKNEYGELIINSKQALVVEFAFDMYLLGVGTERLTSLFQYLEIPSITGGKWHASVFRSMFVNEKYKGDAHLQKTYTPKVACGHTRTNLGEVQSYYITENHPPIVSPEKWERVQLKMKEKREKRNIGTGGTQKYTNRYPLSGLLKCPYCGKSLIRRQGYKKKIQWLCSTYIEAGVAVCKGIRIDDTEVAGRNIAEPTVIEEVIKDGEKHYCYTSQKKFGCGERSTTDSIETKSGSILPRVNRPRRTAIKL